MAHRMAGGTLHTKSLAIMNNKYEKYSNSTVDSIN